MGFKVKFLELLVVNEEGVHYGLGVLLVDGVLLHVLLPEPVYNIVVIEFGLNLLFVRIHKLAVFCLNLVGVVQGAGLVVALHLDYLLELSDRLVVQHVHVLILGQL